MERTKVIDSDGHVVETEETFTKYLEASYRERRPRHIRDSWGKDRWLVEGKIAVPDPVDAGYLGDWDALTLVRPGGSEPYARLKDMDEEGIDVAVLYGTLSSALPLMTEDAKFSAALCQAYNNWLADYCQANPKRLKGVALVPYQDLEEARRELRRAVKELGFVGVHVPPIIFGRTLDHPDFYPLYEEAQDLDIPLGIHHHLIVRRDISIAEYVRRTPMMQACAFPFDNMIACGCLIYGGVMDRFPKLRVALLEAGCSWVPYWMARLEQHTLFREVGYPLMLNKKTVPEYMKSGRFYYNAECEEVVLPPVLSEMGEDYFMYASDYPHYGDIVEGLPFGVVAKWRERQGITEAARSKVLWENAARFYRLDS
jgi:predicted TIM-barrel fold metal-dependent hydrolase